MPIRLPESLSQLRSYVPGKPIEEVQREFGITEIVKLASNENPLGPSPRVIATIMDFARFAALYPDAGCVDLKQALSERVGLSRSQICVGNGSDELIHFIGLLLLRVGDSAVMGKPGFSRYEAAGILAEAETKGIAVDAEGRHDLEAMADAIDSTTRVVWIANPNNPTGTIVRKGAFDRFLSRVPDDVVIVLDEAYFEFAVDNEYPNSADYVRAGKNVIGLRTFSKTFGLAGLRVGYAIGQPDLIEALEKIREPFNVNSIAQRAAIAALEDHAHLERTIEANAHGIRRLSEFLRSFGYRLSESYANFVWCDLGFPADKICNQLLRKGIIIRPGSIFGCPNHVRISVGTENEIDRFEAAFTALIQASIIV